MKLTYKHTKLTCYFAYFIGAVVVNFAPLLFVTFQREFGISMVQLSVLIGLNFGVQMTVDLLCAQVVDKIGYRACATSAGLFSAAGFASMAILPFLMDSYAGLCISVILYAIGGGIMEVIISPMIAALPKEGKSESMSFLHSFYCWGQVATVLLTILYFNLFGAQNWRTLCFLWAVGPFLMTIMYIFVPIKSFTNEKHKISISELFKKGIFWVFLVLMLCSGASEIAMAQWASYFAETALGMSKTVGDLFGPCLFAVAMGFSRVFYGKMSDKLNLANYIFVCSALCILSYILAALSPNGALSLVGCILCGVSVGVMWPGVLSLASVRCPYGGTALFAFLAVAGDLGCMLGPNVVAQVAERFTVNGAGLKAGLLACVIFPLVMIMGTLILKKMKDGRVNE